jgi:uridine kinase
MTCIVAVAGPIGAGKTTLVHALAQALDGASTVHFDHYEIATRKSPAELARWLAAGADFSELRAPGLRAALQALKRGESVVDPVTGKTIFPGKRLILEMPLGRTHAETSDLIDLVIWLDTPLDVALARKLQAFIALALAEKNEDPVEFLRWLDAYLGQYLEQVRDILKIQEHKVAASADIALNGMLGPTALLADARNALGKIRGFPDPG